MENTIRDCRSGRLVRIMGSGSRESALGPGVEEQGPLEEDRAWGCEGGPQG